MTQLKSDIKTYMTMLQQVVKHLKTLLKYLHDQVNTTKDPTVIEQTNRQIRAIEKLSTEVRTSMKHQSKRMPRDSIETFFMMSASEVEISNNRLSADSSSHLSLKTTKRQKMAMVARDSLQVTQIDTAKKLKSSANTSSQAVDISVESALIGTSKTMVQTTDAEVDNGSEHGGGDMVSAFKQKKMQNENRRMQKS